MSYTFQYDQRLGISIPVLEKDWEDYLLGEQEQILLEWESKRADIPGRIKELEGVIEEKQGMLYDEEHFPTACQLNEQIALIAKTINDLNIWYRIQQETSLEKIHL